MAHSVFQIFIDPYLTPHLPPALAIFSAPLWAESSGQWPYLLSSSSLRSLPSLLYVATLIFSSRWSPMPPLPLSAPHLTAGPDTTSHSELLHAISTSRTVLSLLPCRLFLGQFLVNFSTRDFWDAPSFHVWISAPCRLPPFFRFHCFTEHLQTDETHSSFWAQTMLLNSTPLYPTVYLIYSLRCPNKHLKLNAFWNKSLILSTKLQCHTLLLYQQKKPKTWSHPWLFT